MKYKLLAILLFILWALMGCAQKVVEVKVPVRVACVESIPAKPTMEFDALRVSDSIGQKVSALLIDNSSLKADSEQLRALLVGCV